MIKNILKKTVSGSNLTRLRPKVGVKMVSWGFTQQNRYGSGNHFLFDNSISSILLLFCLLTCSQLIVIN